MSDETDVTSEVARVLLDHDADRMACMDHDKKCCPTCDAHDFADAYKHQADALVEAGLIDDAARPEGIERWEVALALTPYMDTQTRYRATADVWALITRMTLAQEAQIAAQEPAGAPQGGSGDYRASGGLDGAPATDWSKVEHTADQCQFEECPSCGCCAHGKEHVIGCSTTLDRPLGTDCPNTDCACKGGMG